MAIINQIFAREILDSRGVPTIEVSVGLDSGVWGTASVPSGSSRSKYEAFEMRDGDPKRFNGLGVLKAVSNVTQIIAPKIVGKSVFNQEEIDRLMLQMDGTEDKKNLGGNTILAVSLAVARAGSIEAKLPLYAYIAKLHKNDTSGLFIPTPMFNILNGGKHGAGNLDFQEYMVVPSKNKTYSQSLQIGVEIYYALKKILIAKNYIHSLGDEGGFAPDLYVNAEAFDVIIEAIRQTSYQLGTDVFLSLDAAATSFYRGNGQYRIKDKPVNISSDEFVEYYADLVSQYRLLSLEDPLEEDDWDGWVTLTEKVGSQVFLVGDDLLSTNPKKLKTAIEKKAANSILIKPNQVGTLTETIEVVNLAKSHNWKTVFSHRSGETNDSFIADLAVGLGADYAKLGAPARGERVAKYNRLLSIEYELYSHH